MSGVPGGWQFYRRLKKGTPSNLNIEVIDGEGGEVAAKVSSMSGDYQIPMGKFMDILLERVERMERKIFELEEKNRRLASRHY